MKTKLVPASDGSLTRKIANYDNLTQEELSKIHFEILEHNVHLGDRGAAY